jgi:hypothetical protein
MEELHWKKATLSSVLSDLDSDPIEPITKTEQLNVLWADWEEDLEQWVQKGHLTRRQYVLFQEAIEAAFAAWEDEEEDIVHSPGFYPERAYNALCDFVQANSSKADHPFNRQELLCLKRIIHTVLESITITLSRLGAN